MMVSGRSLSSSSRIPGIGLIAWFLELGPAVWPVPPTTSGPDSGIFDASMALPASGCSAWPADTPSRMGKAAIEAAMIVRFIGTSAGDGESTRGGLGRCIRARSAARRQGELGVLERLLDHRNAGWVARLALLYAAPDVEAQRLLAPLGIPFEVLLVLGDQRLAIVGVARLGERRDRH